MKRDTELTMEHVLIDTGSKGQEASNSKESTLHVSGHHLCVCVSDRRQGQGGHSKYGEKL